MKRITLLGVVMAMGLLAEPASAGFISATATISSVLDSDGIDHDYTITLKNSASSTDPIGTFWFAWTPGKDFMTNRPISETTPPGWTANVTGGGPSDGFAIQWVANSAAADVAIGSSLTFGFKSAETPAELAGFSQFYPTVFETTSTLYNAAPFSADSETIVASQPSAVPEPSSLVLSLFGGTAFVFARRIGRKKSAPARV